MRLTGHGERIVEIEVEGEGPRLRGLLHEPLLWPNVPCVILCHGLLSSMASPKFGLLASELGQRGIAALRFDFRGCGESEGRLEESTVSARLNDLIRVLKALREELDHTGPLGIMGSSMGGFIALLAKKVAKGVSALCVWATPFEPLDLISLGKGQDQGKLGLSFYEDLKRHTLNDMKGRLSHILVIHGARDEIVPVEHALRTNGLASPPKKLWIIEGGDHRLSDPHHRREATRLTVQWFEEHLLVADKFRMKNSCSPSN